MDIFSETLLFNSSSIVTKWHRNFNTFPKNTGRHVALYIRGTNGSCRNLAHFYPDNPASIRIINHYGRKSSYRISPCGLSCLKCGNYRKPVFETPRLSNSSRNVSQIRKPLIGKSWSPILWSSIAVWVMDGYPRNWIWVCPRAWAAAWAFWPKTRNPNKTSTKNC